MTLSHDVSTIIIVLVLLLLLLSTLMQIKPQLKKPTKDQVSKSNSGNVNSITCSLRGFGGSWGCTVGSLGGGCVGRFNDSNLFFSTSVRFNCRSSSYDVRTSVARSSELDGSGASPAFFIYQQHKKLKHTSLHHTRSPASCCWDIYIGFSFNDNNIDYWCPSH